MLGGFFVDDVAVLEVVSWSFFLHVSPCFSLFLLVSCWLYRFFLGRVEGFSRAIFIDYLCVCVCVGVCVCTYLCMKVVLVSFLFFNGPVMDFPSLCLCLGEGRRRGGEGASWCV